jgi:hypothetical protein
MWMDFDVTSISAVVAAIGVLVGVVYYILDMRHQSKMRQTDMVMRLYATFGSTEFQNAYQKWQSLEFKDFEDFLKRWQSDSEVRSTVYSVGTFFEGIGVLLHRKLIDIDLVDDLLTVPTIETWKRYEPLIATMRVHYDRPEAWEWFEYLYNELKKREQKLQQSKA